MLKLIFIWNLGFLSTAAFGRLCVETYLNCKTLLNRFQPPSGGCVLKLHVVSLESLFNKQPPSGGCVLKQFAYHCDKDGRLTAAFGRLCVETERDC